jgi:hypothetical protein
VKHAVPTTVRVPWVKKPVGFVYHRIPGNERELRPVPVWAGIGVRDLKKELSRVRRGRDVLGRRVRQ